MINKNKLPYSSTGYWVRQQGYKDWEDASEYVKYAYGKFYDEEEVAKAYMQYLCEFHPGDYESDSLYVEVLNSEDKIYTYEAYAEPRLDYYANFKTMKDLCEEDDTDE